MGEAWAPTLADVARHIPTRTRDTLSPGSDTLLATFTEATTPTAEQAQADLDAAVRGILADVGPLPAGGGSATAAASALAIQSAARDAAEWRAAADIEIAYPQRDADVRVAAALDARARYSLEALRKAMKEAGTGLVEDMPQWAFPDPPFWGDEYL